jgi:eukaryotic-like serine/threonine-protein kinase
MTHWLDEVTDEHGNTLKLGERLGKGGQGIVRRVTNHPGLAVKFISGRPARPLEEIRRLPLAGLPIAAPVTLLHGHGGYVMRLADDMSSLQELVPPQFGDKHDLLWYGATGGLRRRLRVAAKTAGALAQLHGLAMVYVDLNPGNVMVSRDRLLDEVLLIDADNIDTISQVSSGLGTYRYFAPERLRGISGPTTLTDAHSLAVLVFALLTMRHPFQGEQAEDLEGDAAVATGDVLRMADEGQFAYIDHPSDESNRSSAGIPRRFVLSPVLRELAESTFIAGMRDSVSRPSVSVWCDALWRAEGHVIDCAASDCNWSYYRDQDACPSCETLRPRLAGVAIRRSEDAERTAATTLLQIGWPLRLTERHLWGAEPTGDAPLTLELMSGRVAFRWVPGANVEVLHPARQRKTKGRSLDVAFKPPGRVRLRLVAPPRPTRIIDLDWLSA